MTTQLPTRDGRFWVVVMAPAMILAAVGALVFTHAASATQLSDAGAVVRWGRPIVTGLTEMAAAGVIGGLMLMVFALPATSPAFERARTAVAALAPVWTVLLLAQLVLTYATTAGRPLGSPSFGDELVYYVTELGAGRARLTAVIIAAVTAVAAVAVSGYGSAVIALVGALATIVPIAATGHAAGAENHELGMTAGYLHIAFAAIWVGGLAFLMLTRGALRGPAQVAAVAQRFSTIAIWCFVGVGVSGIANAWIRIGTPGGLLTAYGAVLLAKVAAFVALGAAGWWHRVRTIAQIPRRPGLFWRLAGGELVIMSAAMGLAVALASTAPPLSQDPIASPTPTELISERQAPPPPTPMRWLTEFYPDLLFGSIAVIMLVMYLRWVLRLHRRGDRWPAARTASWVVGAVGFGYVSLGGPAVYGHVLFSAHMVGHMSMVLVLPIFLTLGAPVTLALRALPARTDGSRGPREWLLALVHSRWARAFANPLVAAGNLIASMVLFYFTPLMELAMTTHLGHIAMVVHFSLVGYMFVNVLIGVDPGPTRPGYPLRLVLLLATMASHAFIGIAIISMTTLIAADYFGALGLPWGVDALADQRSGGEVTWGIGEVPSAVLAVAVAISWARADERLARRKDRAADRDGDAELDAYNEMLAGLAEADRAEHQDAQPTPHDDGAAGR